MQSPSFLAHQQAMQDTHKRNNAMSLFGIEQIPSAPQIRNLLDPIPPAQLSAPFWEVFDLLQGVGALQPYRSFDDQCRSLWMAPSTFRRVRFIASAVR